MNEIFKDIEETNGYYQISNFGRVKSIKRKWVIKDIILTTIISKKGYCIVNMNDLGKMKVGKIHRLVATAFIPNSENKPQVNHIDGNKLNNHDFNLEWSNRSDNMKHAFSLGLAKISDNQKESIRLNMSTRVGKNNPNKRNIIDIQNNIIYETIREAAKAININHITLRAMLASINPNKTNLRYYNPLTNIK